MSDSSNFGLYVDTHDDEINHFLADIFDTMTRKGHDYRQGNDTDILHNFRSVAEQIGIRKEDVWFTYFYKHYSALVTYIKERGQSESEPVEGRIEDMIVYLLLFYKMVKEQKKNDLFDEELHAIVEHSCRDDSDPTQTSGELRTKRSQQLELDLGDLQGVR